MKALMDKHKYIALIEYALEQRTFSMLDACEATGVSQKEFQFIRRSIFVLNAEQDTIEGLVANRREVQDWVLSPEAYFNYLQYCEFKHSLESAEAAQKSATKAFWVALAAIVVSIASTLVGSVI